MNRGEMIAAGLCVRCGRTRGPIGPRGDGSTVVHCAPCALDANAAGDAARAAWAQARDLDALTVRPPYGRWFAPGWDPAAEPEPDDVGDVLVQLAGPPRRRSAAA